MFTHRIDDRLELRPLQLADAEAIFSTTEKNRTHIAVWLPWVDKVLTADDTRSFIRSTFEQLARGEGPVCGIWLDQRYVGGIGYHNWSELNHSAEIGYWLDEHAQGLGVMTRSLHALVGHGFNDLKLNRVEVRCAAGNERSAAVAKRAGFRQEGVLKNMHNIRDTYHDMVVYGLLASDWRESRASGNGVHIA